MQAELELAYRKANIDMADLPILAARYLREDKLLKIQAVKTSTLNEEALPLWESAVRELLPMVQVAFSYSEREEAAPVSVSAAAPAASAPCAPVAARKPVIEAELPENGAIAGVPIGAHSCKAIQALNEDDKKAVIEGRIVSEELKEGWGNKFDKGEKSWRVRFNLTDEQSSIYCSVSFPQEWKAQRFSYWLGIVQKKDKRLLVRGGVHLFKKTGELSFAAYDVNVIDREYRMDNAAEKRVELHLHSKMSNKDGITDLTQAFLTAKRWGHKALAVTDHGVVQAFPEAAKASAKTGVKALFGVEGYLLPDTEQCQMGGSLVAFDIETTGLKAERCEIIEIGAVRLEDGRITERFQTFVSDGEVVPPEITKLTGITTKMLEGAPSTREALTAFQTFAGDSCLIAHNARFDVGFITTHGAKFGIAFHQPYADTLTLSRCLLRDKVENHKLDTLCAYFNVDMGSHHRADDDACSCAQIFLQLSALMRERGVHTIPVVPDASEEKPEGKSKERQKTKHIIILARTQAGMKDLYRIISYSHLDYFHQRPRIPRSLLTIYREHLLIGSACEAGELFRAVLEGKDEETLLRIASFYDFLEIQPIANNRFLVREGQVKDDEGLRDLNRRIVALGEKLHKPVVATGDVHFLEPEDGIYRQIILYKQGFEDTDYQAPLYFKTTEEMLEEFSYLGEEKAKELVVDAPNRIADLCDTLKPFPDGTHAPEIPNASEELRSMAVNRAHEIYGDPLPEVVQARLDRELNSIIGNGYASLYLMAQRLVHKSNSDGYIVGSRGSVGSSFVATMAGITEVNPLQPHYVCPKCKHSDFDIDRSLYTTGADMPDKDCPVCGTPYKKAGFEIPFEVFLGFKGDKTPDIDLNFSGEYQPEAHKYVEVMFGKGHAFRAGTISGIAEKTAFEYVYHYMEGKGLHYGNAELERLSKGCMDVKVTTGQHPGGIVIVPKEDEIYDYTPIQRPADKVDQSTITTHFDFHAMDDRLVKLDILGHDDPTALRMMEDLTGVSPHSIPLDDPDTRGIFSSFAPLGIDLTPLNCSVGTLGVPEFGTGFVRQVLEQTRPKTIEELVRIAGLTHGTDVWLNNAEPLVTKGIAKLNEVLCTRDDIMNYLIAHNMEASLSFSIMERVRKGRGLTDEMEDAMKKGNIPAWFIDSCKKIKYMFPRGHAVAYTMMAFDVAYFKVHYPLPFYAVYYTVRADAFDITKALGEPEMVLATILEMDKAALTMETAERKKSKELQTILEVVYEMYLRGIGLMPVDIYKSQATRFIIEGNAIRPPFNAIPGIGATAAEGIVERRGTQRFATQQDFAAVTGANSGVMAALEGCGCFNGLPKTKQISLFDL